VRRWIFLICLGVAGASIFRRFAFEGIYLASSSMEPAYPEGLHVMVNKFAYLTSQPKRGDVVMFDSPVDPSKGLIKRVIAIGGDTIEIRKKQVILNGVPIDEPYVQHVKPNDMFVGDNIAPIVVPPGTLFVMGDNRDVSGDSRDWKNEKGEWTPFLSVTEIRGRVGHS
jgi:signal peptidase I